MARGHHECVWKVTKYLYAGLDDVYSDEDKQMVEQIRVLLELETMVEKIKASSPAVVAQQTVKKFLKAAAKIDQDLDSKCDQDELKAELVWTQIFSGPNFYRDPIFYRDSNFFQDPNFFSGPAYFRDQHFFWDQNFFGTKIFFGDNFFYLFSRPKFFLQPNFYPIPTFS